MFSFLVNFPENSCLKYSIGTVLQLLPIRLFHGFTSCTSQIINAFNEYYLAYRGSISDSCQIAITIYPFSFLVNFPENSCLKYSIGTSSKNLYFNLMNNNHMTCMCQIKVSVSILILLKQTLKLEIILVICIQMCTLMFD
jgi:hypothetical protein